MKVLTVAMHKGGVGKTTVARLIAAAAGRAGIRVLAIDVDAQCSMSQRLLQMRRDPSAAHDSFYPPVHPQFDPVEDVEWDGISSSADPYFGREVFPYPTPLANVEILPAHGRHLRQINKIEDGVVLERIYKRLAQFLSDPDVREHYDLVVIDTPPSLDSPLPESALLASTHMLIPAMMEPQCIEGLQGLFSLWMRINSTRIGDPIELVGIQVNMYQPQTVLHRTMLSHLQADENLGPFVLPSVMRRRVAVAESDLETLRPGSVLDLKEDDPAREEAEHMAASVLSAMGFKVNAPKALESAA